LTKIGLGKILGDFFSQTHLVTLLDSNPNQFPDLNNKWWKKLFCYVGAFLSTQRDFLSSCHLSFVTATRPFLNKKVSRASWGANPGSFVFLYFLIPYLYR
jgi:hypothetical protein